ncbi:MAG: hypothetical protein Q9167_006784, partial [Letrouitia subvulpina]
MSVNNQNLANKQKVVVVGAGPVGALAALYAADRGDDVEVYELRGALSERGITSIRHAYHNGLLDGILTETIPMHGRMIHGRKPDGELYEEAQLYDAHGRVRTSPSLFRAADVWKFIRAVDRAGLNKRLLDSLEKMPNVALNFNHKLTGADFQKNIAWFEQQTPPKTDHAQNPTQDISVKREQARATEISVTFDLLIGADGAHSAARFHMMKFARVNYQQEYIDTLWCEFHIRPRPDSSYATSPNHLHIWPGGSFMFIAIPSLDKSFVCTLFAPSSYFESLARSPLEDLPKSFSDNFPGVCPELISPEDLQRQFSENPHLPLISIKCTPYHFGSSVVILGDAAHAMVPFYGQGMNAGLEDVRVLFDTLDSHGVYKKSDQKDDSASTKAEKQAKALSAYTSQRTPDAAAINDLALRNYEEMRAGVKSPLYRLRKWVEESISVHMPWLGWGTQYSRVSFENERYSDVERSARRQGQILTAALRLG